MEPPPGYVYRNHDAAKRFHDIIALHQEVLSTDELLTGRYIAVRLSDGGSDGVAYESRTDAVEGQRHNASRCGYYRIPPKQIKWGIQTCDVMLWYVRTAYDNGHREDPAHQLIVPTRKDQLLRGPLT